jgi:hypothetical protein
MTEAMQQRANILWQTARVSARVRCEIWAAGDEDLVIIAADFSSTTKVTQQLDLSDARD